jgi:hypothetical protein
MPKRLSTPQALSKVLSQFTTTGSNRGLGKLRIFDKALWRLIQEAAATIQHPRPSTSKIHKEILGWSGFDLVKERFKDVPGIEELAAHPIPNKFNNEMISNLLNFPGAAELVRELILLILAPIEEGNFGEMAKRLNLECCSEEQHNEVCATKWRALQKCTQNYVPRLIGFGGLQPLNPTDLKNKKDKEDADASTVAPNIAVESKEETLFYESFGLRSPSDMLANDKGDPPVNE